MNTVSILSALALALTLVPAKSQAPLTEGDLLKGLDTINLDPANKQPSGLEAMPKKDKTQGQTEITADNAEFNNKTRIAIFNGDVIVKNPEFNVTCDRLTAYLKQDTKPGADKPKPATPPPGEAAPKPKGGGLERAVAEMTGDGKVIITQDKMEADGSITRSVGKANRADYNAVTGDVKLIGWPEFKQGINKSVAVEEGTVMIMNMREGKMKTIGRAQSLLQDSGNDKPSGKP